MSFIDNEIGSALGWSYLIFRYNQSVTVEISQIRKLNPINETLLGSQQSTIARIVLSHFTSQNLNKQILVNGQGRSSKVEQMGALNFWLHALARFHHFHPSTS